MPALIDFSRTAPVSNGGQWADFALRAASALVLAPLALACIWLGGVAWWALAALAGGALTVEWLALCRTGRVRVGFVAAGLLYLALALVSLLWLRADPASGRQNLLLLLAVVCAADIGGYFSGRAIGGARLAPRISPGKTWSGTVGGLLAAMAAGVLAAVIWSHGTLAAGAGLGLLLGVASQCGDLAESWVKRRCGVKDSGRLIPGHGGVLDRLDGVLLAAPVLALVAACFGRGVGLWN